MLRFVCYCIILMLLAGCAGSQTLIRYGNAAQILPKLTPVLIGREMIVRQQLRAKLQGKEYLLECVMEITSQRVDMVWLGTGGQRVASLRYDGGRARVTREMFSPSKFPYEEVLSIVELVFLPLEALSTHLPNGWAVQQHDNVRNIYHNRALQATIHYRLSAPWQGWARYESAISDKVIEFDSVIMDGAN